MGQELLEILNQFGAGGHGDPGNSAVRFLLAAFFWFVLAFVSTQQYRRNLDRRDLYIGVAALLGLFRELLMFFLEYGSYRGFIAISTSYRFFPPLGHALANIGHIILGFAWLRYFLPGKYPGKNFLWIGTWTFAALYAIVAPLWSIHLVAHPDSLREVGVDFALFKGDAAFHIAAAGFMATVILRLARAGLRGRTIPLSLYMGFLFLFLDDTLMIVFAAFGTPAWLEAFFPIRNNLAIWAIPCFLATYWGDLFQQLREEKTRAEASLAERVLAEEALTDSEERYRTVVEHIDMGISLLDDQFRIIMVNSAQVRLFRRPSKELIGKHCFREFEGRDAVCSHCPAVAAMADGKPSSSEIETERGDGSRFTARIQAFPVMGGDGKARGFINIVEDVTEQRRVEEERRRFDEKILQTQKLESLGILAGGIAHDFNNLLVSMLGNVDLAQATLTPESPVRPYLQRIEAASQRAADLTNQMLAYSGKGRFIVEPINLSRLVDEMGHLLSTVISKRAMIRYNIDAGIPPVEADATQIRQVVMNLITNASDALGVQDGVITITTGVLEVDSSYPSGSYLEAPLSDGCYSFVEVSDNGCGMDIDTKSRIFEPFYTTKHTGRGLGLAAVLGIVRGHRGGLRVYSEPGHGTTFKVLLPAISRREQSSDDGTMRAGDPIRKSTANSGTILVVDDEESVRDVARLMLEKNGFNVLTANDGLDAIETYRARMGEISAILLDMTMPRMGGEEAFRELRRIDPDVRVVLSSGYNEQDAVNRFTGKRLAGFIQKPYRSNALIEKIQQAIN